MPAPHTGGRDARAQAGRGPEHRLVKAQWGEDLPGNEDVEWLARHAPDDLAEQDRIQVAVDDTGAGQDPGRLAQHARHERRAVADGLELRVRDVGAEP